MTNRSSVPKYIKREPMKSKEDDKTLKPMNFSKRDARKWRAPQNHGRNKNSNVKMGRKKGVRK